jgi:hypothetical protein
MRRGVLACTALLGLAVPAVQAQGNPGWYHEPIEMQAPVPKPLGMFGKSLAAAGDVDGDGFLDVLFGAPNPDPDFPAEAILYFGPDFTRSATLRHPRGNRGPAYGSVVCGLGDVDGNGKADVLVADAASGGVTAAEGGEAFLYMAPGVEGLGKILKAPQPQPGNDFGAAAACLGDIDGNGAPDVLIGAPYTDRPPTNRNEGQAFLYYGPAFTQSRTIEPASGIVAALFGSSVAHAGDVDRDGHVDLVVGAPQESFESVASAGAAYVFFGPDFTRVQRLQATAPQANAQFGFAVAGVGDTDGDQFDDVLVGEPFRSSPARVSDGAAYLFLGPTLQQVVPIIDPEPGPLGEFGGAVARIGDVDRDGKAELFISAHGRNTAMLLRGPDRSVLWTYTLATNAIHWGESLACAGDLNRDGAPDLLVGMPRACVAPPPAARLAAGSGIRAESCADPNNIAEAGLIKIILSGLPKFERLPAAGSEQVRVVNVHPAGGTIALRQLDPPGGGDGLLSQATDGAAGDADGAQDGAVLLVLAAPLEDGMRVRPENVDTGLMGREALVRSVGGPPFGALAAALGLAALHALRRRARGGSGPEPGSRRAQGERRERP